MHLQEIDNSFFYLILFLFSILHWVHSLPLGSIGGGLIPNSGLVWIVLHFTSSSHLLIFSSSHLLFLSLLSSTTSDILSLIQSTLSLSLSLCLCDRSRADHRSPFIYLSSHLSSLDTYIHSSSLASLSASQPLSSFLDSRLHRHFLSHLSPFETGYPIWWRVRHLSFLFPLPPSGINHLQTRSIHYQIPGSVFSLLGP